MMNKYEAYSKLEQIRRIASDMYLEAYTAVEKKDDFKAQDLDGRWSDVQSSLYDLQEYIRDTTPTQRAVKIGEMKM